MSIEIKQLIIKSNVADDEHENDDYSENNMGSANSTFKNDVLIECRRLIMEILSDKGYR